MIAAAVALSALALIPAPRSFCWTGLSGGQEPVRCPRVWVLAACTEEPKNAEVKAELPARRVLGGVILGEAYNTDSDDVVSCVKRAGERREVLVLTSSGMAPALSWSRSPQKENKG